MAAAFTSTIQPFTLRKLDEIGFEVRATAPTRPLEAYCVTRRILSRDFGAAPLVKGGNRIAKNRSRRSVELRVALKSAGKGYRVLGSVPNETTGLEGWDEQQSSLMPTQKLSFDRRQATAAAVENVVDTIVRYTKLGDSVTLPFGVLNSAAARLSGPQSAYRRDSKGSLTSNVAFRPGAIQSGLCSARSVRQKTRC